jgi:hypothetical protein
MTLGDILSQSAIKDLAGEKKNGLLYTELIKEGKFEIKLTSTVFPDAFIECSIPDNNLEDEKNYLRTYFLSMIFNAAIHGMKRFKHKKNKR